MRKILPLFLLLCSALCAESHDVYFGIQTASVRLDQPGIHGSRTGFLTGPLIGYRFRHNFYADVNLSKSWGTLHPSYHMQDILADGSIGYTIGCTKRFWITPLIGVGYEWTKESADLVLTLRKSYFSAGALVEAQVTDYLKVGLNGRAFINIDTTVEIGGFSGSRWELTHRTDCLIQMPWTFTLPTRQVLKVALTPYFRSLRHGHSTARNSDGTSLNIQPDSFRYIGIMGDLHVEF